MPNHFHLLIQARGDGNVARFMQKLMTGYTMYFNKLNERTGSLFQGTYQSVHANTDRNLKYLFAYIHLNPLKLIEPKWKEIGLKDNRRAETYLQQYPYSSFQDFLGNKRPEKNIIALASFPLYFDSKEDLKKKRLVEVKLDQPPFVCKIYLYYRPVNANHNIKFGVINKFFTPFKRISKN